MRPLRSAAAAHRRRFLAAFVAALGACAFSLPALGASAASTAPMIAHETVARPGEYVVVVSFPKVPANGAVTVSLDPHHQANVPLIAPSPAAVEFFVRLRSLHFTVHAAASIGTLPMTVKFARASAPTRSNAPKRQSTGPIGTAPITDPYHALKVFTGPRTGAYDKLVWSDEFAGAANTTPNPVNWTLDRGGSCGSGTLSTNTQLPANAALDGAGAVDISALRSASGYTSAQLDTAYKFSFKYGRIEARIEQPAGQGLCSAFWLLGDGPSPTSPPCWPGCGEIDVAEMVGQMPTQVDAFMHGPYPNDPNAGSQQWGAEINSPTPLTYAYHTYGVIWRPYSITWTIDGVPYARVTPSTLPAGARWVYNKYSAHIVLDLEVGGWPGAPSATTTFPARMRVDWVRVYQ